MNLKRINCVHCNNEIEVDMDATKFFCTFCGQQVKYPVNVANAGVPMQNTVVSPANRKFKEVSMTVCPLQGSIFHRYGLNQVKITLKPNVIEFSDPGTLFSKQPRMQNMYMNYEQVTRVDSVIEEEKIEKKKSVKKRAAVGGALFGDTGAIVGAIDGAGTKTKTTAKCFLVLNYVSSSGNNEMMKFYVPDAGVGFALGSNPFLKTLKGMCPNIGRVQSNHF